ncbi:glycosyltransferase family 2 protein [Mesorhizobium sp. M0199]|uniref:glycosyltransferase family 2 protein n=1 Tax=Mesorhizobium sp. M0199 TaxID=2956911 RepID=UPI003337FC2E
MKISVVIPSYNQAPFVKDALVSVLEQDYAEKEVLFLDGGSTDGTMEIIEPYRSQLAVCISEKDTGQSDALAKGFARATGQVLTWLNTDDVLLPGALADAARVFNNNPTAEWAFGNVIWIDAADTILRCRKGEVWGEAAVSLGMMTACGPSAFFSRNLYERVGGINRQLHYMMDTELWWRFAFCGSKYVRLPRYTWALRLHESAKTSSHMFSDRNDPNQLRIEAAKAEESEHIAGLKNANEVRSGPFMTPFRIALKAASPGYIWSHLDSWRWRGRSLRMFLEQIR